MLHLSTLSESRLLLVNAGHVFPALELVPDTSEVSLDSCNDLDVTFTIQTVARDQVDCDVRKPAPQCAAQIWISGPR